MAIKGLVLAVLVLSAKLSEAAVLGPGNHWPRLASVSNTTTSQEPEPDTATDSPTSPVPSLSSDEEVGSKPADTPVSPVPSLSSDGGTGSEPASSPRDVESPSDSSSATAVRPYLTTTPPCPACIGDDSTFDGDEEEVDEPQTALITSENGDVCTPIGSVVTVYSIIYTETLTWTGDPSDYVPPYAELTTPTYCDPEPTTTSASSSTSSTIKWTLVPSLDDGYRTFCLVVNPTSCLREPVFNPSVIYSTKPYIAPPVVTVEPITSTFFITSKNPTVVFPPDPTPDYGAETDPPPQNPDQGGHHPAETNPPQSVLIPDFPSQVTITADPTKVVIGGHTVSDLKPGATTRVTVGSQVYEINPSKIIQIGSGGKTVNRPGVGQALTVATPTSTVIDGLSITVSGSKAVIGGYTYAIGPTAGTEIIQGRTVVISPTGISFENTGNGVTYHASLPEQTGVIVAGGEMLTLIGQSVLVIHETTITYGPGIAPQTKVVDDDTIVAGPDGVTVHGLTIGGDRLGPSETNYDVVGGATLTRVGPSKMVIGGVTYTVGPGTGTTTTFVGGEDITIAPDGITVDTLTIPFPFGATVVTAIPASPRTTAASPQETDEDEEDGGPAGMRPSLIGVCIAIGAWALLL